MKAVFEPVRSLLMVCVALAISCSGSDASPSAHSRSQGEEGGAACGPAICPADQECCNASCGICVNPGEACVMIACEPCGDVTCAPGLTCCNPLQGICTGPGEECILHGEVCRDHVCGPGEFCCNPSCGTCAPRGGFCTMEICADPR